MTTFNPCKKCNFIVSYFYETLMWSWPNTSTIFELMYPPKLIRTTYKKHRFSGCIYTDNIQSDNWVWWHQDNIHKNTEEMRIVSSWTDKLENPVDNF